MKDEKTEAPGEHIPCPAGWWQISRPALNFVLQCEDSGGYLENAVLMTFYSMSPLSFDKVLLFYVYV